MNKQSKYLADFTIAGMRYWDGSLVVCQLKPGQKLDLVAEPDNAYDPDAVAIYYKEHKLGFVPREFNGLPAQLLRFGHKKVLECRTLKVDERAEPWDQIRVGLYFTDKS